MKNILFIAIAMIVSVCSQAADYPYRASYPITIVNCTDGESYSIKLSKIDMVNYRADITTLSDGNTYEFFSKKVPQSTKRRRLMVNQYTGAGFKMNMSYEVRAVAVLSIPSLNMKNVVVRCN